MKGSEMEQGLFRMLNVYWTAHARLPHLPLRIFSLRRGRNFQATQSKVMSCARAGVEFVVATEHAQNSNRPTSQSFLCY